MAQNPAGSLIRSEGHLGAHLRRQRSRLGAPKAITATAHKLARLVYLALKNGIQYVRVSAAEYEKEMRQRQLDNLKRKARQMGMQLVEMTPG